MTYEMHAGNVLPHDRIRVADAVLTVSETRLNDDGTKTFECIDDWTLEHVTITFPSDRLLTLE